MFPLSNVQKSLKEKGRFWIVFTGDSITSCEWVHPNWREIVEYVLKDQAIENDDWKLPSWGIRAFNFAYDGATTKNILDKVDDINLVKPDLVISLMGGNDPAFKLTVSETLENINVIKEKISAKTIWCTSTPAGENSPKNAEYEPYAKAVMEIPQTDNFNLLDIFNIYKQFPLEKFFTFKSEDNPVERLKEGDPDLQHPNQLGNAYIAKVILKEVFGIEFDPERYIQSTMAGDKSPSY